jgi:hypothetical protein
MGATASVIKEVSIAIPADDRADSAVVEQRSSPDTGGRHRARGEFVDLAGERYYAIRDVDKMSPFFISVVSNDDHWLFASSTGGLSAGRVSPATALFPYITVDKIHESTPHTGSRTLLRVHDEAGFKLWEPFNREQFGHFRVTRNLYKNTLGNKLCFEEVNEDLDLAFRYTWMSSRQYGFVRQCELENRGRRSVRIDVLDGLQNVLPAGTPLFTQTNVSNLVDAYKWTELDEPTGLAIMTLYSAITDRAEPSESLKAATVFCLGLEKKDVLISSGQITEFRLGRPVRQEAHKRGIRGAYLVSAAIELPPLAAHRWQIVANTEQTQKDVVALRLELRNPDAVRAAIAQSIDEGSDKLARILASGDGFQVTAEENVAVHHYANVLFNVLRGGVFHDHYRVPSRDFSRTVRQFNRNIFERNRDLLDGLPPTLGFSELMAAIDAHGDPQLRRLAGEYLPITFGRRHGDPSRPWNQFAIRLKDDAGEDLLSYEGNWRDIFQNWEALAFSFPEFVENMIAKFVNASTMDGYNPYRITKDGIDWEVEEPDNPWSYIGYWGDHQIIYLQKLLELSSHFHPARLRSLLRQPVFCYANVPYRIKPFDALLEDPKDTVTYDDEAAQRIERRVAAFCADGKLVLGPDHEVRQVNLLEKLLVPLLSKLGNLVLDGGVWLNTQRPEWNDANNALVGHGLSMVTLYYMRRYVQFLSKLIAEEDAPFAVSNEVRQWLVETASVLARVRTQLEPGRVDARLRYQTLLELGQAASRYREAIYRAEGFSGTSPQEAREIRCMLDDALVAIDHSISTNRRDDGLFHAYNLMDLREDAVETETLYPMLEGQVAVLSSGAITPAEAVPVLEALFDSKVYRPDQRSFMLYPDRPLPGFLEKNRISPEQVETVPLIARMIDRGDERVVARDAEGCYRFSAEFRNAGDLNARLDTLHAEYGDEIESARPVLESLYELVFQHKAFTGRSGTMFGFEGLGSIYWHMVSKLLLAVQENFFTALDRDADSVTLRRLGHLYYRVREGIGFNKTPAEYGAFPTDPYSHTPRHAGARQPGMTGQVKEEILSRFGELGVRVADGVVRFQPALLRRREFLAGPRVFRYLDVAGRWQQLEVPADALAFTWCQVPIIYRVGDPSQPALKICFADDSQRCLAETSLHADHSAELFRRSGRIRRLELTFSPEALFSHPAD